MSGSIGTVGIEVVGINVPQAVSELNKFADAITSLDSTSKSTVNSLNSSFSNLGGAVTSNTGKLTTEVTKVGDSVTKMGGDVQSGTQKVTQSFNQIGQGSQTLNQAAANETKFGNEAAIAGTKVEQLGQSTEQGAKSLDQLSTSVTQTAQAETELAGTSEQVTRAQTELTTATQQTAEAETQLVSSTQQVVQAETELQNVTQQTVQAETQLIGTTQELVTATDQQTSSTTNAVIGVSELNRVEQEMIPTLQQTKTEVDNVTTSTDTMTASTEKAATGFDKFNSISGEALNGMGNIAGAAVNLSRSVTSLGDAQLGYERKTLKAKNANDSAEAALRKYNKAVEEGSASQQELALLLDDSNDKLEGARIAQEAAASSQVSLNQQWASFGLQVIPSVIQGVLGGVTTFRGLSQSMGETTQAAGETSAGLTDVVGTANTFVATGRNVKLVGDDIGESFEGMDEAISSTTSVFGESGQSINDVTTALSGITDTSRGINSVMTTVKTGVKGVGDAFDDTKIPIINMNKGVTEGAKKSGMLGGAMIGLRTAILPVAAALGIGVGAFVAIVAAAALAVAAIAAYGTNFMGFRDIVNGVGVAIGDLHPVLKAAGEGLVGLAGVLGLTGETAEQTQEHFVKMGLGIVEEVNKMQTAWHNGLAEMQQSDNILVQDFANTIININSSVSTMSSHFSEQLTATTDTWNKFVGAVASGDFETAVDLIQSSLEAIPEIFNQIGEDLGGFGETVLNAVSGTLTDLDKVITKGFDAALASTIKWATDVGNAIYGGINVGIGLVDELIDRIVPGWGDIKQQVGTFVTDNIVTPLTAWWEDVTVGAEKLWGYIIGSGDTINAVVSWVTDNIIIPIQAFPENIAVGAAAIWDGIVKGDAALDAMVIGWVTDNIIIPIQAFPNNIAVGAEMIWTGIIGTGSSIVGTVVQWVSDNIIIPILAFTDNIAVGADAIWTGIIGTVSSIEETIKNWVETNIAEPIMKLPEYIQSKGLDIIKAVLGFNSPLGGDSVSKLLQWNMAVAQRIHELPSSIITKAGEILDGLLSGDVGANISKWVEGVWAEIKKQFDSLIAAANEKLAPIGDALNSTGKFLGDTVAPITTGLGDLSKAYEENLQAKNNSETGVPVLDSTKAWQDAQTTVPKTNQQTIGTNLNVAYTPTPPTSNIPVSSPQLTTTNPNKAYQDTLAATIGAAQYTTPAQTGFNFERDQALYGGDPNKPTQFVGGDSSVTQKEALGHVMTEEESKNIGKTGGAAFSNIGGLVKGKEEQKPVFGESNVLDLVKGYTDLQAAVKATDVVFQDYNTILSTTEGRELLTKQAVQARQKIMQDMDVALVQGAAYNKEYSKQIAEQGLLQKAAAIGAQEQEKRLMDQTVALFSSIGATEKLNEQMKSGLPQLLAHAGGIVEQKNALINAQLETEKAKGKMEEYGRQLETGVPQANAYNKALIDQQTAFLKLQETTGATIGTYVGLIEGMRDATTVQSIQNQAFADGALNAAEWGVSLLGAQKEQEGFRTGLVEVARSLDVLPESFRGTNEQFQEFISISTQAGAAYDSFIDGIRSGGQEIISGLGDAIRTSNKDFNKAIEELEEEAGFKFDNALTNAFESQAGINAISKTAQTMLEYMDSLGASITPEAFENLRKGFADSIEETFDDIADEVGPKGAELVTELLNAVNAPVDLSTPGAFELYMANIGVVMTKLAGQGSTSAQEFITNMDDINNIKLQGLITEFGSVDTMQKQLADSTNAGHDAWVRYNEAMEKGDTAGAAKALGEVETAVLGTGTSAEEADPKVAAFYEQIANYGTIESVAQTIFATNIPAHALDGITKVVGHFTTMATDSVAQINKINEAMANIGSGVQSTDADTGSGGPITPDNTGTPNQGSDPTTAMSEAIANIKAEIATIPEAFTTAFNTGISNAMGMYNLLNDYTITLVENINSNLQPVIEYFTTTFNSAIVNAMGTYNLLNDYTITLVSNINSNLAGVIESFTTNFNQAIQNAMGTYNTLNDYTKVLVANIASTISKIPVDFNTAFSNAAANANTHMNNIRANVATVMGQIATVIDTVIREAASKFGILETAANTVMQNIDTAARTAAYAVQQIGLLAEQSASAVRDLADALNDLPDIERSIIYTYETRGTPPAALGGFFPSVMGTRDVIVGENGREFVQVSRMEGGGFKFGSTMTTPFITNGMKKMTVQNNEMLTVVPLEGRNAQQFGNKYPGFKGLQQAMSYEAGVTQDGTVISGNTTVKGSTITINGKIIIDQGFVKDFGNAVSDFSSAVDSQSNNASGSIGGGNANISNPNIGTGGKSYVPGAGNPACNMGNVGSGTGTGSGTGSGSGSGGSGSGTTGGARTGSTSDTRNINHQTTVNGTQKYYRVQNGQISTNMTDEEIRALNSSYPLPQGGGNTGGGTGTGTGGSVGSGTGNTTPGGGGSGTGGTGSGTGTGGSTGGGDTGGGTISIGPNQTDSRFDRTPTSGTATTVGNGSYSPKSGYIKPGGWGANGWYEDWFPVKMKDNNNLFKITDGKGVNVATDFLNQNDVDAFSNYYILNNNHRPPGTRQPTSTHKQIERLPPGFPNKKASELSNNTGSGTGNTTPGGGGDSGTGTGTGTGGGGSSGTGNTTPGGGGGTGTGNATSGGGGLIQPDYVKIEGNSWSYKDANQDPMSWKVVPMKDDPSKYKVVDDKGRNVATNFSSKQQADAWLEYKQSHPMYEGGPIPNGGTTGSGTGNTTPGGGGGTGTGTGTGTGGGTGAATAAEASEGGRLGSGQGDYYKLPTGYWVPSYVKLTTASPNANWDPKTWKAVPMTSPDKKGLWKVVDDKGVNVITEFKSQAEAEEFIAEHKAGVQPTGTGTGNTTPGGGGGTGTGSGTGNTTPGGGTGGSGGGGGTGTGTSSMIIFKDGTQMTISSWNQLPAEVRSNSKHNITSIPQGYSLQNDNTIGTGTGGGTGGGTGTGTGSGNATPSGGVQQSQVISQNSIVNQGNNSNTDLQSGTNSRLRIQNGQVVEATGIYANYKAGDPLPYGSGGSGSGLTTVKPTNLALAALLQRPDWSTFMDAGHDFMGTGTDQSTFMDPMIREFGFNTDPYSLIRGGSGTGGGGGSGGGSGGGGFGNIFGMFFKIFEEMRRAVETLAGKEFNVGSLWRDSSSLAFRNIGSFL